MAENATLEQLKHYHRLLLAERRRRAPASFFDREAVIEEFLGRLDVMAERLRAGPAGVEATPAEMAQIAHNLDVWFAPGFSDRRD